MLIELLFIVNLLIHFIDHFLTDKMMLISSIYFLIDSGYYITGKDSLNIANTWKYLFSSGTVLWQKINNILSFLYRQLMISDSSFFILGYDSWFNLHFLQNRVYFCFTCSVFENILCFWNLLFSWFWISIKSWSH